MKWEQVAFQIKYVESFTYQENICACDTQTTNYSPLKNFVAIRSSG